MKSILVIPIALALLTSCSDEATSQAHNLQPEPQKYVLGRVFNEISLELDKRISLISPPGMRSVFTMFTANGPHLVGLSTPQHFVAEGSYRYITPDNVLALEIAPTMIDNHFAELLDPKTHTKVGLVYFYDSKSSFPKEPSRLEELCTGAYQLSCTLRFDAESSLFTMTVPPQ